MQCTIGVKQILGEEWGPHGPRAAGTGFWLPTIEFPDLGYEWRGPEAYKGVQPALLHLLADASSDRSFAVPELLETMREEIARAVGRWLDDLEERQKGNTAKIAGAEGRARVRARDKGLMVSTISVHCAHCSRWDSLDSKAFMSATDEAKRKGWRQDLWKRWVCEHHKEEGQ